MERENRNDLTDRLEAKAAGLHKDGMAETIALLREAKAKIESDAQRIKELEGALDKALLRCDELTGALKQGASAREFAALQDVNSLEADARAALSGGDKA